MTGNLGSNALGQCSRKVFQQTSSGDVRHSLDNTLLEQGQASLDINLRGSEQRVTNAFYAGIPWAGTVERQTFCRDQFSNKAESVAVNTAACKTKQGIPRTNILWQNAISGNSSYRKASKIVISGVVHGRHFCRFTTNESTPGLPASLGNAFDDFGSFFHLQMSRGKVIEEEQGFASRHDEIVYTHGHKIDSNRGVFLCRLSDSKLGSYTIGGSNQNRLLGIVARRSKIKETTKTSEVGITTRTTSGLAVWFDHLYQIVSGINAHTSVGIADNLSFCETLNGFHKSRAFQRLHLGFQTFRRVVLCNRNLLLDKDRSAVHCFRHFVNGAARFFFPCIDNCLVDLKVHFSGV
mmetsp:Transcript_1987/g.4140  ORF Transcript_1987/g.4140 Transcript_1987/m.4140 type:complete len:350 (+) Transcript_1987:281-1330(+)